MYTTQAPTQKMPLHFQEQRCDLTASILYKWENQNQNYFVRFLDGNKSNCAANNLQWASLKDVIDNPTFVTDWDVGLSPQEIALINDPSWLQGLVVQEKGSSNLVSQ